MDADLWGDTFSNRAKLEAEGLPVNTAWHATAGPGYNWWLDPSPGNNSATDTDAPGTPVHG